MEFIGKQQAPSSSSAINILDRPLIRPGEAPVVSLSAFSFLLSEIIQYNQNRVNSISDLEKKLEEAGFTIGIRVIELVCCRERLTKRETRLVNMLQFICNTMWKYLFNKAADNLERSTENEDEYMIHERAPITNTFVSLPADYVGQLNCAAFIAGIIAGILDSAMFPARVTAHHNPSSDDEGSSAGTVFLIKFTPNVMSREKKLENK